MLRRAVPILLLVVALASAGATLLQRQQTGLLREQVELLGGDLKELRRLQAENARLRALQPDQAELDRLRADRVAGERLRAELNALRARISDAEAALEPDGGRQ